MSAVADATTRAAVIARGSARLRAAGVADPERDARILYRWAAEMDGARLSASLADRALPAEIGRFEQAVADRAARAPLAQIIGSRLFWGRRFRVTGNVLDPRPETETLVAHALEGPPARRILDLGTGSGCILLTLLAEWPKATGVGVDLSPAALEVAAQNARELRLAERADLRGGDWCAGLADSFDLVVANPPYLAGHEFAALEPEVRLHEPVLALAGGADGLDAYRRIAAGVGPLVAPGGRLLLEIGPGQAEAVTAILRAANLAPAVILCDLDGRNRVVAVSHPEKTG